MSKQLISVLGVALIAIGAGAIGLQACSSKSSGNGAGGTTALCNQACDKAGACFGDAGATIAAQCKASCNDPAKQNCTNQAAITTKANECLAIADCDAYIQCIQGVPDCQGGSSSATGSAGASGTATGTTTTTGAGGSTGGSGAGASCDVCTKSDACCVAIGGTADQCTDAAACNSETGQNRADIIDGCTFLLQAAASDPNSPAACK